MSDPRARLLAEELKFSRDGKRPSIFSRIYPAMDYGKNCPPQDQTPCTMPEVNHEPDEKNTKDSDEDGKSEQLSPFVKRLVKALVDDTTSWFPPTSSLTPDEDESDEEQELRDKDEKTESQKSKFDKSKFLKKMAPDSKQAGHD